LRVIGIRAIPRLATLIDTAAEPVRRAAAFSALEGIDDRRAVDLALTALPAAEPAIVLAAVGVLRGWLTREPGTRVLDALTAVALDRTRDSRVRLAALDALSELPRELVQPVFEQGPVQAPATLDDPGAVRDWIADRGAAARLSELHDAIARMRERERAEPSARLRQEWLSARAAAHAVLARRGSRLALYDLKETFEAAATPLPLDFLTAITALGDASCLEAIAHAWAATPHESWWRERLSAAATDIMQRTRVSGRSAVVKRIRQKWNGFV
jgi:hypothetical protein